MRPLFPLLFPPLLRPLFQPLLPTLFTRVFLRGGPAAALRAFVARKGTVTVDPIAPLGPCFALDGSSLRPRRFVPRQRPAAGTWIGVAPGGVFAFDVQMPDLAWLIRDPAKRWARTRFTDPTTKRATFYSTNHDYDPVSQIAIIRLYYEPVDGKGAGRVVKLSQRKFFPAELEALVAHAGLRVVERFGDFLWRPLDGSAESQVLVCEKANPRRGNVVSRRGFRRT